MDKYANNLNSLLSSQYTLHGRTLRNVMEKILAIVLFTKTHNKQILNKFNKYFASCVCNATNVLELGHLSQSLHI